MNPNSSCKCRNCNEFFESLSNNRGRQKYCSTKPECRKASKVAAQARWRNKPENREHFSGPHEVQRVRDWRSLHPGYWRKKRTDLQLDALQDFAPNQDTEKKPFVTFEPSESSVNFAPISAPNPSNPASNPSEISSLAALQDLASVQVPLLAGFISLMVGDALQDRFEVFARDLVERGKRVLGESNTVLSGMPVDTT